MSEQPARVLVVDDEEDMQFVLGEAMRNEGYAPLFAPDAATCLRMVGADEPDVLLLDIKLPDRDGLEVLEELAKSHEDLPIIMMTGHGSRPIGVQAIHQGAYDYFTKPFDLGELRIVVRRALEKRRLLRELAALQESLHEQCRYDGIVGESGVLQDVLATVARVADTDVTVLICGESGTGKELVARAIRDNSSRRDKPFVKVNCAAIPDGLIEAELFGHEQGAFTDAKQRRRGKFELADRGTLFLDEVGDMPLSTQAKLVRVLQEREFERVGGEETIKVDVRVIAATNKDLEQAVGDRRFREDLYYRLSVVAVSLPSLAQRRSDIPLLVDHFLEKYKGTGRGGKRSLSPDAMEALMKHDWPGNVRELENCIQRALVLSDGDTIELCHLPPHMQAYAVKQRVASQNPSGKLNTILAQVEKELIIEALREAGGVQAKAARRLGVSERSLWYKVKKYGICPQDCVSAGPQLVAHTAREVQDL